MDKVIKLIKSLIEYRWFGELVLKFVDGRIVLIKKSETIKP
jgi:hypothetical protein